MNDVRLKNEDVRLKSGLVREEVENLCRVRLASEGPNHLEWTRSVRSDEERRSAGERRGESSQEQTSPRRNGGRG